MTDDVGRTPRWRRYLQFIRPRVEGDVDEELAFHLESRVERNIALGMTPEAARRDAESRFGDVTPVRDVLIAHDRRQHDAEQRAELVTDFAQDVRFGWRSLSRAPGFAAAAILTIALGIGANTAIFSVVNAVLLRPLPYAEPDRLMSIGTGAVAEYLALRERLRSFSDIAAWTFVTHPIDDGHQAVRVEGVAVTPNLFSTLGVHPFLGRLLTDDDSRRGANNVLLISYDFWQTRFGGTHDVLGRQLLVEGSPMTVVGVMPAEFRFPTRGTEYWQPYLIEPGNIGTMWAVGDKRFVARLRPAVTMAQATREVKDVWPTLRRLNPLWDPGPEYRKDVAPAPLQTDVVGTAGTLLWILFGCVVLVLLIACVNVANLLLARATAREQELSIRAALGGGRGRLVRQLVTESLMLSLLGAALGLALASVGIRWLVSVMPAGVPRTEEIVLNGPVLAFAAALAVMTGVLFGIVPALRATSRSTTSTATRRTTAGIQHHRMTGSLVVAEVALALLLVIGATLLVRSFGALRHVDLGFQPTHVIAARITPPGGRYADADRVTSLYAQITERLQATPGVEHIAVTDKLPMAQIIWGVALRVEGQFEDSRHTLPSADHYQQATPDYFATMGIPLKAGRTFTDDDTPGSPPVAIVSESFARRFWRGTDAIGQRIGYPWDETWLTIVGVVADTKQDSLRDTTALTVYAPSRQSNRITFPERWVVVRSASDPGAMASAIRRVVDDVDRAVAVSSVRTMDDVLAHSVQKQRFTMLLVAGFALAALVLGMIGIYGVMSYLVGQRTREMGIRLALGASPSRVLGLVVGRGARLALAGTGVGLIAAAFATRWIRSLLFGVTATDPVTFVLVPLLFIAVAVLASWLPARRAMRVDPVRALRSD